ncbi:MAG TPA: hypothetical protein VGK39_06710 [Cyclobacteriaceae bacterium]
MKTFQYLPLLIILFSCYTSKEYYNKGDYYSAVVKSVNSLKQYPSHKSSRETLQKAYPLALQTLEQKSMNSQASNDAFKYKNALLMYSQINALYDLINSSPVALEIIQEPKNYYKEIGDLREKAAEETYTAGIQSMMVGNREGSRRAVQYFNETISLAPQHKDVIEMLCQAEKEGTLRIVWKETGRGMWWHSSSIVSAIDAMPFVDLQRNDDFVSSDDSGKKNFELELNIAVLGYSEGSPTVSSTSVDIVDSVKVGEKKINNVMVPIMETIKGTYTTFEKKVESEGTVLISVLDRKTGSTVFERRFNGNGQWTGTWTKCSGDRRVFKTGQNCISFEPSPGMWDLEKKAEEQIQKDAIATLTTLLDDY